jgi:glucose-1-phosphate thymidylyltransferase
MGRGIAWLDTGTHDSLLDATLYIKTIEDRQGLKIGCLEEIAYYMGFIDNQELENLIRNLSKSRYSDYLKLLLLREN